MTPDQTIALWSVILGGAVGLTGVGFAGLSGWRDRRHTWELAERDRKQRRLEEAYLALLSFTERVGYAANVALRDLADPGTEQPTDPAFGVLEFEFPGLEEQIAVRAKTRAFGSPEVQEAFGNWFDAVQKIRMSMASGRYRKAKALEGDEVSVREMREVRDDVAHHLLPAEREARRALTERIAIELN